MKKIRLSDRGGCLSRGRNRTIEEGVVETGRVEAGIKEKNVKFKKIGGTFAMATWDRGRPCTEPVNSHEGGHFAEQADTIAMGKLQTTEMQNKA